MSLGFFLVDCFKLAVGVVGEQVCFAELSV